MPGSRRAVALVVWAKLLAVVSGRCPAEPLQVLGPGHFARVGPNGTAGARTTCAELSKGSCPIAVPFPEFPCLVSCVEKESDCLKANPQTPSVNPFENPHVCTSCPITACASCEWEAPGRASCRKCFAGFIGRGRRCIIWDQQVVMIAFFALSGVLALLLVVVLVTTAVAALRRRSQVKRGNTQRLLESEEIDDDTRETNKEAIRLGFRLSLMSSIKFSSLRHALRKAENRRQYVRAFFRNCMNNDMKDLGLGLQLFFNTQGFLILVALITWTVSIYTAKDTDDNEDLLMAGDCRVFNQMSHGSFLDAMELKTQRSYAKRSKGMVLLLWVVLVLLSWAFHYWQRSFVHKYDLKTHSAEDYTLRLSGLPEALTSEKRLKQELEDHWRLHGKIHGVSICYNLLALPNPEHIEDMVSRLIEWDDIQNGWCEDPRLSSGAQTVTGSASHKDELRRRLDQDQIELRNMLESHTLRGSGEAFVVFKHQRHLIKIQEERSAIDRAVFHDAVGLRKRSASGLRSNMKHFSRLPASDPHALKLVHIKENDYEPAGIRFPAYKEPEGRHMRNKLVWMPLRMVLYIAAYGVVADAFFFSMVKPWQDNFISGVEGSFAVSMIGKLVILFNFAIQTIVMVDVERLGGFTSVAQVDKNTLVWNTILLLITNTYVVAQECSCEGIRWSLKPPDPAQGMGEWWAWQRLSVQSLRTEKHVGLNLAHVMTEQIMMLYVIGEVANVLLPVVFYWIALRLVFVKNIGGSQKSWVQTQLRSMLPISKSAGVVTAREAEKAQILVPLLLWMEYTYILVFTFISFISFYLVTNHGSVVCGWLFGFSIIFHIWQRYVMLWLYGKATYDTEDSYAAFIRMWGLVLSMLPPASVWWAWRLGEIAEQPFAVLVMALACLLANLVYEYGITFIDWGVRSRANSVDHFGEAGDPGYSSVMEEHGATWWNMNPVYVLKHRHCPNLKDHEVQEDGVDGVQYWPKLQINKGFFEHGKEFRHMPRAEYVRRYGEPWNPGALF